MKKNLKSSNNKRLPKQKQKQILRMSYVYPGAPLNRSVVTTAPVVAPAPVYTAPVVAPAPVVTAPVVQPAIRGESRM